jgi:NAD(P)-dependent dehydrogenase (short-subunit alcohol dehydrogenase family)
MRFRGKVALVTGGARGLGRSCVLRLAEEGAHVVVAGRDIEACKAVAGEAAELGSRAIPVHLDVTDEGSVRRMVGDTVDQLGRLDFAVNNAGVNVGAALLADADIEAWDRSFAVNARGMFACLKYELQHMASQRAGAIVNVASISSLRVALTGVSAYSASKFAVAGLTKAAARDYAASGIRINAVCPGHMRTEMLTSLLETDPELEARVLERIPMRRIAEPAEIAAVVAFLLSDDASFMTGALVAADGGVTI